jgi:ubiquitin carboxyl-terminal hydrolase L5
MSGTSGTGSDWCTIESDPGVFTELLNELGCEAVELQELWSLDQDTLEALQQTGKVHGLIFLFQWMGKQQTEHQSKNTPLTQDQVPDGFFFAHQIATNACATQAVLSVVLNAGLEKQELGTTLADFQEFTQSFPPSLKGEAVAASADIQKVHNAFGRQDAFLQEGKVHRPSQDDEAFHFVAYVPSDQHVYELDGLQEGPIVTGSLDKGQDWLAVAAAAIQERMAAAGENNVKFNLMAVIQDKRIQLKQALETVDATSAAYADTVGQLNAEQEKRTAWKTENERRRHNYVPLCMQLLKELAAAGALKPLVEQANERQAEKRQKQTE